MSITHLSLRNVRCFTSFDLTIENRVLVIEGPNGSGKSTIAEALYYACYLKSFRTHRVADLVRHGDESTFFVKIHGVSELGDPYTIQIGFEDGIKKIKVNDAGIGTYKELMDYYQVVALSEHDLRIIQEGPEERRLFINQFCILQDQKLIESLALHKHVATQRSYLLMNHHGSGDECKVWSEQLWTTTETIRKARIAGLALLEKEVALLAIEFSLEIPAITFSYKAKGGGQATFDSFWQTHCQSTLQTEIAQRRTLFGAHLDDIIIEWASQNARLYASRGQQKLIVLLIKCAMIRLLARQAHEQGLQRTLVFILDDFITDLDQRVSTAALLMAQSLGCMLVVTCPLQSMVTFPERFQLLTVP